MSNELRHALEQVGRRFRRVNLGFGLAACWAIWAIVVACCAIATRGSVPSFGLLTTLSILAGVSALTCLFLGLRSARDTTWIARQIEAAHPSLNAGLLAALEEVTKSGGRLGFLQSTVVRNALDHRRTHGWTDTVPTRRILSADALHLVSFVALVAASFWLVRPSFVQGANGESGVEVAKGELPSITVDPGDTEVERGAPLLVVARFDKAVPAESSLVLEDGKTPAPRPMTRSLEDPAFGARVESVEADMNYRVTFDGGSSPTYKVKVFEYPELRRADARLVFPQYTSLDTKSVEDVRHVNAVEGTELTLIGRLNKEVAIAQLVDEKAEKIIPLTPDTTSPNEPIYKATWTLAESGRYKVRLVDKQGRPNKLNTEIVVNVSKNKPAAVAVTVPSHDVRVSPVEELTLKANAEDDFGVIRRGLTYSVTGGEPNELELGKVDSKTQAPKKVQDEYILAFESLKAAPDQLVTYFFWAEDLGPDGKPRRTSGDMFFAEVRHFEEIFRQGEAPPGGSESEQQEGQQGNAREAGELSDLQKEVINATWKLIRRETSAKPTDTFAADAEAIRQGQASAIEKAEALGEKLTDEVSKANLKTALTFMKDAEAKLAAVAKNASVPGLNPALSAEQAASQALLKLRAREFDVVKRNQRQQQSSRSSSSGSPSQRQLNQLELSNDENRYEQQKSAKAQEPTTKREQEQAETRQVLNRLKELAQRQADLNARLKEMQSALDAAKTPEAREELQRQLKRLREQEQQILRDTDELQERMEREENRDRMAEAREQVEQSRENIQKAGEAIEQNKLSQAVTAGTRAGRQLDQTRDDLRKQASNKFSEEMTDLRDEARKLDTKQEELTKKLEEQTKERPNKLRDDGDREQTKRDLQQQQTGLDKLLDRMRSTVTSAEDSEPLLAKNLFDAVNKTNEQKVPEALKAAEQLAEVGIAPEAAAASRHASKGLDDLRQGVEKAAQSVLGDETAALKRAQAELENLAQELDREMARATGRPPGTSGQNQRPDNQLAQNTNRQNQAGGQQGREDQQGEQQPGEGQQNDQRNQQGQGEQTKQQAQSKQQGRSQQGQQKGQGQQQGRQEQGQQPGQGEQQDQQGQGEQQPGQQQGQGQQGQSQQKSQQGRGQQGQGQQQDQQGRAEQQGQQQPGQGEQGQQPGQGQQGQQQGRDQGGQQQGQRGAQQGGMRQGLRGNPNAGGSPVAAEGGAEGLDRVADALAGAANGPITGDGFRRWSDRLRDVEELLTDPALRAEAARIRDRARGEREEYKRHSKMPDWTRLKDMVADPINELRQRVAEEVHRRESPDSLVPIDRDLVPPQYAEGVRRYYERLGSGR